MKTLCQIGALVVGFSLFGLGVSYLFASDLLEYRLRSLGAILIGAVLTLLVIRAALRDKSL